MTRTGAIAAGDVTLTDAPSASGEANGSGSGALNNGYSDSGTYRRKVEDATDSNTHDRKVKIDDLVNVADLQEDNDDEGNSRKLDEVLDPGEALERAMDQLGPFGFYQRYTLILLCIPNIFSAMYSLNYIFVADQIPFRCLVPECEGPGGAGWDNATVLSLLGDEQCRRPAPLPLASCNVTHYHPTDTVPCDAFVYQNHETIYAEFNLACNEWQRTLVGTVRNAALPVSLLLTGFVSDKWGRRTAFCVFVACAGCLGVVKSFAPSYPLYLAMEFLEAALGYGFNSAAYVMAVELARPSLRAAFACATGVTYGLGGVVFAALAANVRYWRELLRTIHAPAVLLTLYWLLLDDSARWLHASGRRDRAQAVVRKAAQWNKVLLDEKLLQSIAGEARGDRGEGASSTARGEPNPWLAVLRSRALLLRLAVCSWCWVAAAFVYYGLTINSVALAGDKYINFALNMLMEVVASLLIVMSLERFGRKRSIFSAYLVCGFACVTPYFVSHGNTVTGLYFVGKLAISFAYNSLYVFVAELFPTAVRSSALAACSLVGRAGSALAPQTPLLAPTTQALLYGGAALSAALLVLLAPETRRAPLPPGAAAAERLRAPPRTPAHSRVHSPVHSPRVTPLATPADTLGRTHDRQHHNLNTRF
ncbi:organic cation transporter protein-like [Aricia agestis]|uniref:organic cation transporter protein-like n=1 Tax=Aricia agestis TaxID=91739 RepID=UPI001C20A9D7|nr:organic cation transporter protein-like [Aricia agestis]